MKKILTLGTIAALVVMIITALSGNDTGFSLFMNTSIEHTIARAVLIIGLLGIAVTARPRSKLFRTTLGIVSALVIIFTVVQTLNYSLGLLDMSYTSWVDCFSVSNRLSLTKKWLLPKKVMDDSRTAVVPSTLARDSA